MSNLYSGIAGKRVLITGSSNGIGFAMAKALLAKGAKVLVTGSSEATLHNALEKLATINGERLSCVLDVKSPASIQQAIDLMMNQWGGIDILINNAGIGMATLSSTYLMDPLPFWKIDDDQQCKAIIDTNLLGYFLAAKAVVPVFLQQETKGRIITIGISQAGMRRKGFSIYGASRAGSEALSHVMAEDLAGTGITVNILCPGGPTDTGQIPQDIPQQAREKLLSPDIMADATLFLCSDHAVNLHDSKIDAISFDRTQYLSY